MNKAELQKLFAEAPKRVVLIDSVQHIFLGADVMGAVDKKIKQALAAGKTVVENGVSQWIDYDPIQDDSKINSERYTDRFTFDKSGNRVKCIRLLVTKGTDGELTKKRLGTTYRDAIEVL